MAQVQFKFQNDAQPDIVDESFCSKGCCSIYVKDYRNATHVDYRDKYKKPKAGACLYDKKTRRILLVKSRGFVWGCPKGTMEDSDQSIEDCAIREVMEETGYVLKSSQLNHVFKVDRASYYIVDIDEFPVTVQGGDGNDANGIAWIRIDCLKDMVSKDIMKLNSHCKKILARFF